MVAAVGSSTQDSSCACCVCVLPGPVLSDGLSERVRLRTTVRQSCVDAGVS